MNNNNNNPHQGLSLAARWNPALDHSQLVFATASPLLS